MQLSSTRILARIWGWKHTVGFPTFLRRQPGETCLPSCLKLQGESRGVGCKKPRWNPALTAEVWGCLFSVLVWRGEERSGSRRGLGGVGRSFVFFFCFFSGKAMQKTRGLKTLQQTGDGAKKPPRARSLPQFPPALTSWGMSFAFFFPPHRVPGRCWDFFLLPPARGPRQPGCSSALPYEHSPGVLRLSAKSCYLGLRCYRADIPSH